MKKILISTLALALLISCEETALVPENNYSANEIFASTEAFNATKTTLDGNNNVVWSNGDQMIAFTKTNRASKYQIQEKYVGNTAGAFSLISGPNSSSNFVPEQELSHNIMLYPYSSEVRCNINDSNSLSYKLNVTLPEVQSYTEDSFSNGAFPMVAVSENNNLSFKNVCGGLKLQLKGVDKIQSIKLEGLDNEKIAGQATVVGYANGSNPAITMSSSATTSITLDCGEGVQLDESNPTTFIIAVPPVTFTSGMKITVTDTDGYSRILTNSSENTILRSSLLTFPVITYKQEDEDYINLSEAGTANSYIVSEAGSYKFTPTKGNSSESVGNIASAKVLWESFGTDIAPAVGDLIRDVTFTDGSITFTTPETFVEGNAVIVARDANANILWSWHIWLTDQPQGQVYYNNAGTMMDRNLGATSATPGDVGALGLLYQWGRKDPFLGSSNISSSTVAKSTGSWPSAVSSSSSKGTIDYAVKNPMTFITYNSNNSDWYYTGSSSTDNTRWTTSDTGKSIYDPCPAGWRVPDGGSDGVWSKALGSSSSFTQSSLYNRTSEGMNFSGKFGSASTIWYPASGCRGGHDGSFGDVGTYGDYCSASPYSNAAYYLSFYDYGYVFPSSDNYRALGLSVRCIQE